MSNGGTVTVLVEGKDISLAALLTRLEGQMRQMDATANRAGAGLGASLGAGAKQATNSMLSLQQAQARLEASQGNLVGAADRLRNALAQQSTTTTQTIGAQRQLQAVEAQSAAAAERAGRAVLQEAVSLARLQAASGNTAGAIRTLTQAQGQLQAGSASFNNLGASIARLGSTSESAASQFSGALKGSLLGIIGPAAAAGAALGVLSSVAGSFVNAFNFKVQLDGTTASINSQLGSVRDMSTVWSEAAATGAKYRITQAETNEILSNSVDVLRTSRSSVGDLEIALLRLGSRDPSKPISEAARALRELNAGDVTTIKELFNIGAADALKMKNEIQGGADAVQVLSTFLDRAGSGMDILAQRTTGALGAMNDLKVAQEDLTLAQAQFAQGPGLTILQARINVTRDTTKALGGDFISLNNIINDSGVGALNPFLGAISSYNTAVLTAGQNGLIWAGVLAQQDAAIQFTTANTAAHALTMDVERQAVAAAADAEATATAIRQAGALTMDAERQAAAGTSEAILALRAATEGNTGALVDNIAQQQASQLAGQQLAQMQATLASLGGAVAGGMMTAGNAALILAQKYRIAYGAALDLINAEAQLAQKKVNIAALGDQRAGERDGGSSRTNAEITLEANGARLREAARVRREQEANRGSRSRGAAAGAAKLTDQAKLNNQLLTDQEKYQDQAEQAERQHQEKLLDITREAAKRQLAQQKKNEIDKRESELGFLESITASELNATQEGRDAIAKINERYYADFEKAQQAAAAGNAQQSEAMVKAAGERAAAEQRYAEQIEEARQDKNRDEIARLEALREKQRQILDEKDKQIVEGGDANVNQTNEALSAEEQRYAEQQDKAAGAAESASERKVNAAIRNGKAISDENTLLLEQERIQHRMGRTAAPGTAEGGSTVAPGVAAATTPQTAPDPNAGILGALEGIISAVRDAKDAITREQGNTTSAVRGIRTRLVD